MDLRSAYSLSDGPQVNSYEITKIQGKCIDFAYDSNAKKSGKFLAKQATGEVEELDGKNQEID